jgi:hypothetical protein
VAKLAMNQTGLNFSFILDEQTYVPKLARASLECRNEKRTLKQEKQAEE